jgi:hypothetical protein
MDHDNVSPRCIIPPEYRVTLLSAGQHTNKFLIQLSYEATDGQWKPVSLDNVREELKNSKNVAAVTNLKQALACCVVAIQNQPYLYQTRLKPTEKEESNLANDEISISFINVCKDGGLEKDCDEQLLPFGFGRQSMVLLGFNPNLRLVLLEKHVLRSSPSDLLFQPLRHLVGDGKTTALLDEICQELPETFSYLNDEQQKVAHPLMLKTAVEVAGPPGNYSSHTLLNDCNNFLSFSYHDPFDIPFTGTGKTKTIVELVRALLLTTNLDIIVMSERNGAINAIRKV